MTSFFISDLHLDESRPDINRLFTEFLRTEARTSSALYILGDLFETWIGDDAPGPVGSLIANELAQLKQAGVACFILHGNRDFLLGSQFMQQANCVLLKDPHPLKLHHRSALLMHGDTLCTDDTHYQAIRKTIRGEQWQSDFLALPVTQRLAFAQDAREQSQEHTRSQDQAIMDVNAQAVKHCFETHNMSLLIHGHTHRPAQHQLDINGKPCQRIVLGDWYEQGSVLRIDSNSITLENIPLAKSA